MTTYKGFELFSDIKDTQLRNKNRATVLSNLASDNTRDRVIAPKGAALILGYFQQVPEADRDDVREKFKDSMIQKGFVLAAI